MRKKSNKSLKAARVLDKKRLRAQAVPCIYYSIFQLMKYKLANTSDNPISYDEQDALFRGRGSHNSLLNEIEQRINDDEEKIRFINAFRFLKNRRVEADYRATNMNASQCKECFKVAETLRRQLYQHIK